MEKSTVFACSALSPVLVRVRNRKAHAPDGECVLVQHCGTEFGVA